MTEPLTPLPSVSDIATSRTGVAAATKEFKATQFSSSGSAAEAEREAEMRRACGKLIRQYQKHVDLVSNRLEYVVSVADQLQRQVEQGEGGVSEEVWQVAQEAEAAARAEAERLREQLADAQKAVAATSAELEEARGAVVELARARDEAQHHAEEAAKLRAELETAQAAQAESGEAAAALEATRAALAEAQAQLEEMQQAQAEEAESAELQGPVDS